MNKENILGFEICNTNYNELIKDIFKDFDKGNASFIASINPEIVTQNYKNKEFIQNLNSAEYQIPDGIGIVYASKIQKGNIKQRITGIDLMNCVCEESIKHDSKIFLYGSKEGVANKAKQELEKQYKSINIVDTNNGYEEENLVIEKINKSGANILFVGLGSPKQEEFIIKHRNKLKNVKIFMPIGGSLDVVSGTLKRAPNWMIKCNLEWLHRLIKQPKRFFRQLKLIKFLFLALIYRKNNGGNSNEQS